MALPPKVKSDAGSNQDLLQNESAFDRAEKILAEQEKVVQKNVSTTREESQKQTREKQQKSASDFQTQDKPDPRKTDVKQSFGKKINVNPQVAEQNQKSTQPQNLQKALQQNQKQSQDGQQKPLPESPKTQDYQKVMTSKAFQGPMKGSQTFQKVQSQALPQQNFVPNPSARGEPPLFSRGELSQLFSMRHRTDLHKEEQDSLRKLIKFHAAKANRAKAQLKSIQYQTDANRRNNPDALIRAEKNLKQDSVKQNLMQKLAHSAESVFEKILQKVLGGSMQSVPDLGDGQDPTLPLKSSEEWQLFYQNLAGRQSQLVDAKGDFEKMAEALFRGLFQGEDGGMKLVSDLSFLEEGDLAKYKFSLLSLEDGKLLQLLQSLKPGQSIPKEWLQQLGEEFAFLKLMHMVPGMKDLTAEERQKILQSFRREVSGNYQKGLEAALREKRLLQKKDPFEWAGDQFDNKQERKGLKSFFMILTYTMGATAVVLGGYLVYQLFF